MDWILVGPGLWAMSLKVGSTWSGCTQRHQLPKTMRLESDINQLARRFAKLRPLNPKPQSQSRPEPKA